MDFKGKKNKATLLCTQIKKHIFNCLIKCYNKITKCDGIKHFNRKSIKKGNQKQIKKETIQKQ